MIAFTVALVLLVWLFFRLRRRRRQKMGTEIFTAALDELQAYRALAPRWRPRPYKGRWWL